MLLIKHVIIKYPQIQRSHLSRFSQMTKWKQQTRKPAPDQAQLNPITSHPWGQFLNIEALFRCMNSSPSLPISTPHPLNLIRTHWCVDNEGVTRSWERPSNSPHRGSGFLGGVWMSTLLRDACTHVSLWQPLPKSKARHRSCMYYIEIQYRTRLQTFYCYRNSFFPYKWSSCCIDYCLYCFDLLYLLERVVVVIIQIVACISVTVQHLAFVPQMDLFLFDGSNNW